MEISHEFCGLRNCLLISVLSLCAVLWKLKKLTKVYHIMVQQVTLCHTKSYVLLCKVIGIAMQKSMFSLLFLIEKVAKTAFSTMQTHKNRHFMLHSADYDK